MITLKSAFLRATILPRGATLAGLWLEGRPRSLVLGYPRAEDHATDRFYMGAIVGPVANRLRGAKLNIAGETWCLQPNEGCNLLHSGPGGLHARDWSVTAQDNISVSMEATITHGEDGLPGNRRFEARYTIGDTAHITLEMSATSDRDTVCSLAHHPYWTLDDGPTVADHRLQVASDHYLPVDDETLPTGKIASVADSEYDFRALRPVAVDRTLDATLCLAPERSATPRPAALLIGRDGLTLKIETTETGLQLYNGSGLRAGSAPLFDGQSLCPYAGVALEPQGWPDAPHHPHFPPIILAAATTYRQVTVYRVAG